MQETSDLYKQLLRGMHSVETRLAIGESVDADESKLMLLKTSLNLFSEDTISIGSCVSGEIDVEMLQPSATIPRRAKLKPFVRLTDGVQFSEWIQKGEFFIDTREVRESDNGIKVLVLHGYDAMLKAEQNYPASELAWPATDVAVVQEIAKAMGVTVDARTFELMTQAYQVQLPSTYSCREVLGYIAAMYAGCFIMSDLGELRLITLWSMPAAPEDVTYLVNEAGEYILAGGDQIIV